MAQERGKKREMVLHAFCYIIMSHAQLISWNLLEHVKYEGINMRRLEPHIVVNQDVLCWIGIVAY